MKNLKAAINNVMLERHGLIHILNELKNHRIINVCAPAGYGKTVAISQWLNKETRANAFFSVDEYDNNLAGFCERFCSTLFTSQPKNRILGEIVSHPAFQSAPDEFTLRTISALSERKLTILAIDDVHLIHDKSVLQLLLVILKRLPKCFQTVLISRHDLTFGFSELWLKGHVVRINAEQLLFSSDEIKALYRKHGNKITDEQANEINKQTHGWAMGINAFLLSGKETFDVTYGYVGDFIEANVWGIWDSTTRDFMICTAALRELTPSICEAMTGMAHCDKLLEGLVQKGAFITRLSDAVYRYHHLFQQFLIQKAKENGEAFTQSLLETEGNWHLSQMDFYSAFDCFIRCKNHEGIAKCFGSLVGTNRNDFSLLRILPIVKHPEFQAAAKIYPFILFLVTLCAFAEGRADDMTRFMDEYYKRHPEVAAKYPGTAHKIIYMLNYDFRIPLSRLSAMVIGEAPNAQSPSVTTWTLSMHMPLLHRSMRDFSELAIGDVVKNLIAQNSLANWMLGDEGAIFCTSLTAGLLYEQGNLEEAHSQAIKAVSMIKKSSLPESKFCAMSILICILDALEEPKAVDRLLKSVSQMIEEDRAYYLNQNFNALTARRKFAASIKLSEDWIRVQTSDNPTLLGIYIALTTCRAYIVSEEYDSSIILLEKVLGIVIAFNRCLDIIEARILLAIAYWKKKPGFQNEAIENLELACRTAYPYNYVQLFVNDGAVLSGMLYKLQRRIEQRKGDDKKHLSFVKKLSMTTYDSQGIEPAYDKVVVSTTFTHKQKEVMYLICQGKTRKEISEVLGIKQSTIRSHLESIYSKLKVTNVTDAVKSINKMKLLE